MTLNELLKELQDIRARIPAEIDPPVYGEGGELTSYPAILSADDKTKENEVWEEMQGAGQTAIDFSDDPAFVKNYEFHDDRDLLFDSNDVVVIIAVDVDF